MQLLASKFAQIATAINTTNAQIVALQAKLSELQEHQQQLLSVEQACQSALSQVGTALSMLNHVDPSEIGTFKAAVEAQFGTDAIAFLESATPAAEAVEPEPTAPITPDATAPDVEQVIDVDVATVTDELIAPTPTATVEIEGLLNKMTIQDIRKLAVRKKVSASGTRVAIAGRLKAIVTEADIWNATA
jgi:hypothetical protein